jgi:hypothetical protein
MLSPLRHRGACVLKVSAEIIEAICAATPQLGAWYAASGEWTPNLRDLESYLALTQ